MSESGTPEAPDAAAVARELESLERAVGALIDELQEMRRRVSEAEERSGEVREALADSGARPGTPAEIQERLDELTRENEHLREVLSTARTKAERMRSRLIVMEDESGARS